MTNIKDSAAFTSSFILKKAQNPKTNKKPPKPRKGVSVSVLSSVNSDTVT